MHHPLSKTLLEWYDSNSRDLPWRNESNPYAVWISEVMLQQTRVETVKPYYQQWMSQFPTILDVANAELGEILYIWEGLGYYQRARNIHRTAGIIIRDHGGVFPDAIPAMQSLPGIGKYIAAAIGSIAFNINVPAIDGNARRVFARLFDVAVPMNSSGFEKVIHKHAQELLPKGASSAFNQAVMDLGSAICTPRKPQCKICPLLGFCKSLKSGDQEKRPIRKPKVKIPHYTVTAGVIHLDGKILIAQRPLDGMLAGLWEFPGGKLEEGERLTDCLQRELFEELDVRVEVGENIGVFKHIYTHFKVTLHAFNCRLSSGTPRKKEHLQIAWVQPSSLKEYPMGKIDRLISVQLFSDLSD